MLRDRRVLFAPDLFAPDLFAPDLIGLELGRKAAA